MVCVCQAFVGLKTTFQFLNSDSSLWLDDMTLGSSALFVLRWDQASGAIKVPRLCARRP